MKYFTLLLIAALASGCISKLRPDAGQIAVDANYDTLEFLVDGKVYQGDAVIPISTAWPKVEIQGYYKGEVRIDSSECEIHETLSYDKNQKIEVPLDGPVKTCLISALVNPEYPPQGGQDIVVNGFRGNIALRVVPQGYDWVGVHHKVTGAFHSTLRTWIGGSGDVRVLMDGCGTVYDRQVVLDQGYLTVNLEDAVNNHDKRTCILEGLVISPVYQSMHFTALMDIYDTSFSPLAIPLVSLSKSTLQVSADDAVSILSLDEAFVINKTAKFKHFDPAQEHVLRALTVKGRSVLGTWDGKAFTWTQ